MKHALPLVFASEAKQSRGDNDENQQTTRYMTERMRSMDGFGVVYAFSSSLFRVASFSLRGGEEDYPEGAAVADQESKADSGGEHIFGAPDLLAVG